MNQSVVFILCAWIGCFVVLALIDRKDRPVGTQHWDDAAVQRLLADLRDPVRRTESVEREAESYCATALLKECGYSREVDHG